MNPAQPLRAAVIGQPVGHSRSPLIHRFWLRQYGVDGRYDAIEVGPDALDEFLAGLADAGFAGCNVTVPLKEAAFRAVAVRETTAEAVGAVNTIWLREGVLHGDNTDVYGFLANLDAGLPGWDARLNRVVVLGAGGAARGVAYALKTRGAGSVALVNRSVDRAAVLATALGPPLSAHGWDDLPGLLDDADLLVNTTSLGMTASHRSRSISRRCRCAR
jgi:shikimate dehydrogenase